MFHVQKLEVFLPTAWKMYQIPNFGIWNATVANQEQYNFWWL